MRVEHAFASTGPMMQLGVRLSEPAMSTCCHESKWRTGLSHRPLGGTAPPLAAATATVDGVRSCMCIDPPAFVGVTNRVLRLTICLTAHSWAEAQLLRSYAELDARV